MLLLLSPLLACCQFYLKGQVKDEEGRLLQNARIFLHSTHYLYYSGSDGSFGIPIRSQTDSVTVSIDGYLKLTYLVNAAISNQLLMRKAPPGTFKRPNTLSSFTHNLKKEEQQAWLTGNESYATLVDNHFINPVKYPTTGISLNIDRASYSNIRRFITSATPVPTDAVRIEEMMNYFNFEYKEPDSGKAFAINTILTTCPWNPQNELLFAHIHSRKLNTDSLKPAHLVFLIDISASMDMPNRLPLLKDGFKGLVRMLRPIDTVSIIVYGGTTGIVLPPTGGGETALISKVIDSLQPGGFTPGESGIKLAYNVARSHFIQGGNNRIILATDGDFNVGLRTDAELEELIRSERESGIYLTCLGIGMGNYKDSKIQTLAQKGNGNFAYIDSYAEAEKILMEEFLQTVYTVADDTYLDLEFNPACVKEYRIIGFDNRLGAMKDTSAVVEGGEVGAAHSLMLAFEIVPTAEVLNNYKVIEFPVQYKLRYKDPGQQETKFVKSVPPVSLKKFEEVPGVYRFAASVIMFGSLLRNSVYVPEKYWNDLANLALASVDQSKVSQLEFLSIVEQARQLYTKKKRKFPRF